MSGSEKHKKDQNRLESDAHSKLPKRIWEHPQKEGNQGPDTELQQTTSFIKKD